MRTLILTALLVPALLICSLAGAQVVIKDPSVGTTVYTVITEVKDSAQVNQTSATTITQDSVAIGVKSSSSVSPSDSTRVFVTDRDARGAFEFSLESVVLPGSFTSNNFTARLVGISGQAATDSVSLSVDLYDMADDQQDFVIDESDYDIAEDATSINGDPFINGEFEDGTIDVTAQLRADLFGAESKQVSSGFILMASGGTGLIEFPGIADAYIELNLVDSDSDVDTDSDTNTTDTGSTVDTSSTTDTSDSDSDSTGTDTEDSDYWDTIDDTDGPSGGSGDGVSCSCTTTGGITGGSLLNLLF